MHHFLCGWMDIHISVASAISMMVMEAPVCLSKGCSIHRSNMLQNTVLYYCEENKNYHTIWKLYCDINDNQQDHLIWIEFYPSLYLSVRPSVWYGLSSIHPYIYPSVRPSIHLSKEFWKACGTLVHIRYGYTLKHCQRHYGPRCWLLFKPVALVWFGGSS